MTASNAPHNSAGAGPGGRTMVITGASKGIGRALAEHYLGAGHRVVGCSRGGSDLGHENYRHHRLNVADEAAVAAMVRAAEREFGGVDVLLNNAGAASMNHLLLTPASTARQLAETNLVGTFVPLREAAKAMVRRRSGRIVNFTSAAVPLRLEGEAIYAATKAAVESLTRVAARELGPSGITVNAVGPGPLRIGLVRGVPEEKLEALLHRQAIGRYTEVADVINAVDFFIGDGSGMVTGQVLYLGGPDGG